MPSGFKIVTVGLSPAWDVTCRGERLDWGDHTKVSRTGCVPAGKALNISRALAWMGQASTAAGLWGSRDYDRMAEEISRLKRFIKLQMTPAAGSTRYNITVVDTARKREMHLRSSSELATRSSLSRLGADLSKLLSSRSVCVFAGAMPAGRLLADVLRLVRRCRKAGARIVLDTSGKALKVFPAGTDLWLIKPNTGELRELLGARIKDSPVPIAKAASGLLNSVSMVLVSRGEKGAVLVTRKAAFAGCAVGAARPAVSTVGCGDYLLAGFIASIGQDPDPASALVKGLQAATARAWGWAGEKSFKKLCGRINIKLTNLYTLQGSKFPRVKL